MSILENDNLQNLILKSLKSNYDFGYFCKLFKENKFFEYFANLSNKDKFNIIYYIKLIERNGKNLNQNNDEFYNEVKKWESSLYDRLSSEKIEQTELEFIIKVVADSIINNKNVDKNLIINLTENYIFKLPLMIAEELPILLMYNFYLINQFTNSKSNIAFTTDTYTFAHIKNYEQPEIVFINYDVYHQLLGLEQISAQDYYEMFCYQTFALLHEFKHLKQYEYMISHDDEYAKVIGLDIGVISYDYDFYQENHDMFFIEREANEFGYKNLNNFCYNLLSQDYIAKFIELSKASTLSNKLSNDEFKDRYNEICNQIAKMISTDEKEPNL